MDDQPRPTSHPGATLTAGEVAALANTTEVRVVLLAAHGLVPGGAHTSADAHRIRLLEAFAAAGITMDALVADAATGRLDFGAYPGLHRDPGHRPGRAVPGIHGRVTTPAPDRRVATRRRPAGPR